MEENKQDVEIQEEESTPEVLDTEQDVKTEASEQEIIEEVSPEAQEIEKLNKELADLKNRFLRVQAEFDNYKKRTQKEKESALKYKAQDLVTELLPVLDNFNRALETEVEESAQGFKEGVDMVFRQLEDALKSTGVEAIQSIGEEFDPNLHHAVMQAEDADQPSNVVVEELQKGYLLKDRVIRPAMVKVNK